jgi:hypothetical protein
LEFSLLVFGFTALVDNGRFMCAWLLICVSRLAIALGYCFIFGIAAE